MRQYFGRNRSRHINQERRCAILHRNVRMSRGEIREKDNRLTRNGSDATNRFTTSDLSAINLGRTLALPNKRERLSPPSPASPSVCDDLFDVRRLRMTDRPRGMVILQQSIRTSVCQRFDFARRPQLVSRKGNTLIEIAMIEQSDIQIGSSG
jgi:hypothetical protein